MQLLGLRAKGRKLIEKRGILGNLAGGEQYCPLLFLGLQMLAPGIVDWEDRTYIEFCLKEVKPNEKGHLDLPDGLDLEP